MVVDEGMAHDSSLLQKPARGGIPAMAIVPMRNNACVHGIFGLQRPHFRISCSPESAWMTDPAERKE